MLPVTGIESSDRAGQRGAGRPGRNRRRCARRRASIVGSGCKVLQPESSGTAFGDWVATPGRRSILKRRQTLHIRVLKTAPWHR